MPEQLTRCVCYFEFFVGSDVRSEACSKVRPLEADLVMLASLSDLVMLFSLWEVTCFMTANKYIWRKSLYDQSSPCL